MKLGPVTKLDKRNMVMSKKIDHGASSANYDAIFIFPISIQFGAIQKLDSRCMFCRGMKKGLRLHFQFRPSQQFRARRPPLTPQPLSVSQYYYIIDPMKQS